MVVLKSARVCELSKESAHVSMFSFQGEGWWADGDVWRLHISTASASMWFHHSPQHLFFNWLFSVKEMLWW